MPYVNQVGKNKYSTKPYITKVNGVKLDKPFRPSATYAAYSREEADKIADQMKKDLERGIIPEGIEAKEIPAVYGKGSTVTNYPINTAPEVEHRENPVPTPVLQTVTENKTPTAGISGLFAGLLSDMPIKGRELKFCELVDEWKRLDADRYEVKTRDNYIDYLDNFIVPAIGDININEIKPFHIRAYLALLGKDGIRRDGKEGGYSDQTKRHHFNAISVVYRFGLENEITDKNPCAVIKFPKVHMKEAACYDEDEMNILLKALDEDFKRKTNEKWTPLYYDSDNGNWKTQLSEDEKKALIRYVHETHKFYVKLAYIALLRRSEMCGLEFEDIDYANNKIYVRRTSHYNKGKGIYTKYSKLKDGSPYRTVALTAEHMQMIKEYVELIKATRVVMGNKWVACDRLFIAVNGGKIATAGGAVNPTTITQWFGRFLERHGLKHLPLHGLRHSGISRMINQGATSAEAADRAGNTEKVIEERYKHIFDKTKQKGATHFQGV